MSSLIPDVYGSNLLSGSGRQIRLQRHLQKIVKYLLILMDAQLALYLMVEVEKVICSHNSPLNIQGEAIDIDHRIMKQQYTTLFPFNGTQVVERLVVFSVTYKKLSNYLFFDFLGGQIGSKSCFRNEKVSQLAACDYLEREKLCQGKANVTFIWECDVYTSHRCYICDVTQVIGKCYGCDVLQVSVSYVKSHR